jgi:putative membrane protein
MKASHVWFVVAVIYLVGITGFMIPDWVPLFEWLIPLNILFAFAVLLFGEEKISARHLQLFIVCFLFGFFYELAGTKTGVIFGEYTYGKSLGLGLWDVPLLIGVNWFFMVYTSLHTVGVFTSDKIIQTIAAPLLMTGYDFFLEPFAIDHGMWSWADGIIPLQNYVAWYGGGLLLCAFAVWGKFPLRNRFAAGLFGVQGLFFVVLYLHRIFVMP